MKQEKSQKRKSMDTVTTSGPAFDSTLPAFAAGALATVSKALTAKQTHS